MKKTLTLTGALLLAAAALVFASTPQYVTKSGNGNATSGAEVIFPSDPQTQIRIVNVNWNSDTNTAVLSCRTGTGAYSISSSNASGGTITVSTTNGLAAADVLVIEHGGVGYTATISAFDGTTNITLVDTNGTVTLPGDSVYKMSAATTIPIGATTNVMNGEAIYVGNFGRPVRLHLTPADTTNKLNSVTARYE